ncbi:AMP-binding protein [Chloroflexota bacterium]
MSTDRTSGEILVERAKTHGHDPFYIVGDETITYGEVNEHANSIGNSLLDMGVKKGDKICALLRNSIDHIYVWFATAKIGAALVPINIQLEKEQLTHIINNSDAKLLLIEADLLPQLEAIQDKLSKLKKVIISGGGELPAKAKWEVLPFRQLLRGSAKQPEVEVSPTDLACLLYTSGTTGLPKGVMCSHRYYTAGGEILAEKMKETREDVFYGTLPLYHIMGQVQAISTPLHVGGKVILADRFSVSRFWESVRRYQISTACLTGTQCVFLFQQTPKPDDAQNSLRIITAFPTPSDIVDDFENRFGTKIRNVYGLTEALLPLVASLDGPYKKGSLGQPTDYEVRIADDADNELPDYEVGNIILRPKAISRRVFDGYYKKPEASVDMLKHCWFHTGDVGYRDPDGFFWFASRRKDVIRFRGENISAPQVESIISSHSKIAECAVIGVPSDLGEEDVKTVVRLKKREKLKPEELMAFCEDKMTWFMMPRYVEFVDELPKTATDKVEKFKLKDNWKTPATWDREAAGYQVKKRA